MSLARIKNPFTCDLCKKSYARINELDAHLVSYDHLHNERRRGLRQVHARTAPAPAQSQDNGMLKVLPLAPNTAQKKKTSGFKSAFERAAPEAVPAAAQASTTAFADAAQEVQEYDDAYDPRCPTTGWTT